MINLSPQEQIQQLKNNLPETIPQIYNTKVANGSLVKAFVFIQDNGFNSQMTPITHPITNGTETKQMDFIVQDYPLSGWELVDHPVHKYLEKQPHVCIIQDLQSNCGMDALSIKQTVLSQKLPGVDPAKVCVVKTIGPMLPLNQLIEVVGYFETSPVGLDVLAEDQLSLNGSDLLFSLPTIHCIDFQLITIQHLVPKSIPPFDASYLRMNLIKAVKNQVLGDLLAAEYIAAQLFYQIAKRIGGVPTSKFTLNVYDPNLKVSGLSAVLEEAWPMTKHLDIHLESLQNSFFQPTQDRVEDFGLCHGLLQQPDHTLFLLNETRMRTGKLQDRGVLNVQALQNCMDFGVVEYQVPFGSFEKESNFTFLAAGTSASLLNVTCKLPLVPVLGQSDSAQMDESVKYFIASIKSQPFEISQEMEKIIQEDFATDQVLARNQNLPTDDGTLLMQRLVLAECIAKSYGLVALNRDAWDKAGRMEKERLRRLAK